MGRGGDTQRPRAPRPKTPVNSLRFGRALSAPLSLSSFLLRPPSTGCTSCWRPARWITPRARFLCNIFRYSECLFIIIKHSIMFYYIIIYNTEDVIMSLGPSLARFSLAAQRTSAHSKRAPQESKRKTARTGIRICCPAEHPQS